MKTMGGVNGVGVWEDGMESIGREGEWVIHLSGRMWKGVLFEYSRYGWACPPY